MEKTRHRTTHEKIPSEPPHDSRDLETGKLHVQVDVHASPLKHRDSGQNPVVGGIKPERGGGGQIQQRESAKTAKLTPVSPTMKAHPSTDRPLSIWEEYNRGLEMQPLFVKSLTSFCGFFIADSLAQLVTGVFLDHRRLVRMLLFGILVHGPLCHFWYKMLDDSVLPSRPKSVMAIVLKIVLDQLIFGPVFLIVFWFSLKTFEGRPADAIDMCVNKMFPTLMVSYMLWPAAHIINFKYVPSNQRVLYINLVTIFWTTYLSLSAAQGEVVTPVE